MASCLLTSELVSSSGGSFTESIEWEPFVKDISFLCVSIEEKKIIEEIYDYSAATQSLRERINIVDPYNLIESEIFSKENCRDWYNAHLEDLEKKIETTRSILKQSALARLLSDMPAYKLRYILCDAGSCNEYSKCADICFKSNRSMMCVKNM